MIEAAEAATLDSQHRPNGVGERPIHTPFASPIDIARGQGRAMEAAAVGTALEGMGIRLRPEWLEACLAQLPPPPPGARRQQEQWVLAQVRRGEGGVCCG